MDRLEPWKWWWWFGLMIVKFADNNKQDWPGVEPCQGQENYSQITKEWFHSLH